MPVPNLHVPAAAEPRFGAHFDAWNSSSTGHQRAENRLGGSTGWRQSRSMKLSHQFKGGLTGGKRISDQVGAGSKDWDEKAKALITPSIRERAKLSVGDMLIGKKKLPMSAEEKLMSERKKEDDLKEQQNQKQHRGILDGLVIYINGSTHPIVSDHKLKHIIAENGGRISIHLGRKQVTHCILGMPSGGAHTGAGGGLASGKMDKEIRRVGGKGIKYVGVEWILESLKAGTRLPEANFSNLMVTAKGQQSVYGMFKKMRSSDSSKV